MNARLPTLPHPWGKPWTYSGHRVEVSIECWEGFTLDCVCDYQPDVPPSNREPCGIAESIEVLSAVAVDEEGNRGGNIASMFTQEQLKRVEQACMNELANMEMRERADR